MSDDSTVTVVKPEREDADILLYDYSKFLLTLGLLMLGGILTLVQGPQGAEMQGKQVVIVVIALALSCLSSLSVANDVVRARQANRATTRWAQSAGQAAMFFLGAGVAMFLLMWTDILL